jgi:hypothetical protein
MILFLKLKNNKQEKQFAKDWRIEVFFKPKPTVASNLLNFPQPESSSLKAYHIVTQTWTHLYDSVTKCRRHCFTGEWKHLWKYSLNDPPLCFELWTNTQTSNQIDLTNKYPSVSIHYSNLSSDNWLLAPKVPNSNINLSVQILFNISSRLLLNSDLIVMPNIVWHWALQSSNKLLKSL